MPEILAAHGYSWSINLDPDVIATGPWDLRSLLDVKLIAGRPVGRGSRTVRWLQEVTLRLEPSTASYATLACAGVAHLSRLFLTFGSNHGGSGWLSRRRQGRPPALALKSTVSSGGPSTLRLALLSGRRRSTEGCSSS